MPSPDFSSYAGDEQSLALLGSELASQDPSSEVILSEHAAGLALAAWQRDDEGSPVNESDVERAARDSAATLALIGLGVEERGVRLPDGRVSVRLHPQDIWAAVATAKATAN